MKTRRLRDIEVSAIGMGCMGFTHAYGKAPEEKEAIRLVHRAFELGCTFFDTAEMYSFFKNGEFVGKALKELPRDQVVISDKFYHTPSRTGNARRKAKRGRHTGIARRLVEASPDGLH